MIKADTVIDGTGRTLSNTNIVVQGSKISRMDPNAKEATYYLENRAKFIGGNFNEAGFAFMEKGIPIGIDTFKRAR